MTHNKRLDKFEKKVSNNQSNFLSKLAKYEANQKWLNKSSEIAANVLEVLKEYKLSQRDLADRMEISAQQINKILKGQQNLTLETISNLELALDISLLEIVQYKPIQQIKVASTQIKATHDCLVEEFIPNVQMKNVGTINQKVSSMTVIYKNELSYEDVA